MKRRSRERVGEMRAVLLTGHGGLDKLDYRTDVPIPRAGRDEVLIRVAACGINNTDINTRTGWYSRKVRSGLTKEIGLNGAFPADENTTRGASRRFPIIQGADAVGYIVAVGEQVCRSRIGERVIVDPCIRDPLLPKMAQGVAYFGTDCNGGFAEYAAVSSRNAIKITSALTDPELASFACSYSTAEEMLTRANLTSGETLLVTGASGGVGSANIQLAKLRAARVIAFASAGKEARLRALGADLFVRRDDQDIVGMVAQLVEPQAVDVVADVVGGPSTGSLLRTLRRAGRYVIAGAIAGPVVELDLRQMIYKDLALHGVTNPQPEAFLNVVRLIESGQICALVDRVFGLQELAAAQEAFLQKEHVGKFVVVI